MKKVLFVYVKNAGRSQMAEAFAISYGKGKLTAQSAGIKLADRVNPVPVQGMKEIGIDISAAKPKMLTQQMADEAYLIVTRDAEPPRFALGHYLSHKLTANWKTRMATP